jgi:RimJ/RimL family protein N-acetyltransferase
MPAREMPEKPRFLFRPIAKKNAAKIASWRYPPPYELYNMRGDGSEFLDPRLNYHVWRIRGHAKAFLCWGTDAQVPGYSYDEERLDVGWGLAPEMVGHGLGKLLVLSVLQFVGECTARERFRATVADFNERCRRACRNSGFREVAAFESSFSGRRFIVMHAERHGAKRRVLQHKGSEEDPL